MCPGVGCGWRRSGFADISRPARVSTVRAASPRETTPSRLGSPSSANITGVEIGYLSKPELCLAMLFVLTCRRPCSQGGCRSSEVSIASAPRKVSLAWAGLPPCLMSAALLFRIPWFLSCSHLPFSLLLGVAAAVGILTAQDAGPLVAEGAGFGDGFQEVGEGHVGIALAVRCACRIVRPCVNDSSWYISACFSARNRASALFTGRTGCSWCGGIRGCSSFSIWSHSRTSSSIFDRLAFRRDSPITLFRR